VNKHIVLTFIAADKPGLVEKIASVVNAHQANWLDSRLAKLAGKFAGIVRIDCVAADMSALTADLEALSSAGFSLTIEEVGGTEDEAASQQRRLDILGIDRPGIVNEIAQALAAHQINVDEFNSQISSAPMSGEPLFDAEVMISLPESVSLDDLMEELDSIANELTLDITLSTV
jgi:glycine cleavage system regulatory protein